MVELKTDGAPLVQEKRITELTQNDLKQLIHGAKVRTVHEQTDVLRKKVRDKTSVVVGPVVKAAFAPAPEKKLLFLGCYRIVLRGGVPSISKAANLPMNAQRVLLQDTMGETNCFIELTKWSM